MLLFCPERDFLKAMTARGDIGPFSIERLFCRPCRGLGEFRPLSHGFRAGWGRTPPPHPPPLAKKKLPQTGPKHPGIPVCHQESDRNGHGNDGGQSDVDAAILPASAGLANSSDTV